MQRCVRAASDARCSSLLALGGANNHHTNKRREQFLREGVAATGETDGERKKEKEKNFGRSCGE